MCGIIGLISAKKTLENGARIKKGIHLMNDRGNGLGAGYAAYGIYPRHSDCYALQIMGTTDEAVKRARHFIAANFTMVHDQPIPVWNRKITDHPSFHLFFARPPDHRDQERLENDSADDYTAAKCMELNSSVEGAFTLSSGKNMGVFKGVGTPLDIYEFFKLDDYEGYSWLGHNRFPTNTPGWWGGAHPFNILEWSIVHNGEISSYGINSRYLEALGYPCLLQTDSEVIAYLIDLLIRRHGLTITEAATALAPPYWSSVERMAEGEEKAFLTALKVTYEQAMLNGPFAVLAAFSGGMFSLTDNTKLRPMTSAVLDDYTYFASEIAALYEMEDNIREIRLPRAGQPVIALFEDLEAQVGI